MKKILAFNGSPRIEGNTVAVIDKILDGARTGDVKIEKVHLNAIKMDGCQALEVCRSTGVCAHDDSFSPYYKKINEADCFIFVSPLYMSRITGQMKCFIDRLYPYIDDNFNSRMKKGKKAVLALTWAASGPGYGNSELDFWATFLSTHMEVVAKIGLAGISGAGDFLRNSAAVEQAYQAGVKLVE
jgi:multimeric flavodoxin WrbA